MGIVKSIGGRQYQQSKDGLYYRDENVDDLALQVPMYINRTTDGWQVRFTRKGLPSFSKFFADGGSGAKQKNAQIKASLKNAIKALKAKVKEGDYELRDKYEQIIKKTIIGATKKNSGVAGMTVRIAIPHAKQRDKTPGVVIGCSLGGGENRVLGPHYRPSIFSITEHQFQAHIRDVILSRKYMEHQYLLGKTYSHEALQHISYDKQKELLAGVDASVYKLDTLISDLEEKWAAWQEERYAVDITHNVEGITVVRLNIGAGELTQLKTFHFSDFESPQTAERLAALYAKFLRNTVPYKASLGAGKPFRKKPLVDRNKRPQPKTGVTGVSYSISKNGKSMSFICYFWDKEQEKVIERKISMRKHGVFNAFILARETFNELRGAVENDMAIEIKYKQMLPRLIKDLPSGLIDEKIAKELEGVVYSSID